ncbi:hypothetical protein E2C01_099510 [Portunus trituberculatus]|uniref:Uncharacterized protein n=1 Tax=Portunus trituberculatus TaxID=210409 RepID=A0A5B7KH11_PORTR|nr:hypothetical protein [Portunus trituberculatus]
MPLLTSDRGRDSNPCTLRTLGPYKARAVPLHPGSPYMLYTPEALKQDMLVVGVTGKDAEDLERWRRLTRGGEP